MAPSEMRGLTQYIADLRACRVRELEEKRVNQEFAHIRQKFKEGNLDGRQRKKYMSKLVFSYVLGYPILFGHMEAIHLISSSKYSEKQIGYLAVTLLLSEENPLIRLVINSIAKDLVSNVSVDNCLALHAIANLGGQEMAVSLADDVHRLLVSPTSQPFVKKKAALTLLRLYRKHADVIPAAEWALRIVSIMDDANLGVALAVTSLVMTLAQDNLEAFAVCYQKAVDRLAKIVIEHEYSADYIYYKVPIPWLQVKLLRLLQYYPPSDDPTLRLVLHNVLTRILKNSAESPKNVQHNNAQNAVLFEAINLAIHLDSSSSIVTAAATLLGRFILSKETNVRYLGLDTMAHLAARSENLAVVQRHQATILLSLRDKDISVRRRGLDLLYSMCSPASATTIIDALLDYLPLADYGLREEMVLKIAVLLERFAKEGEWYFDRVLGLMEGGGEWVPKEVGERVVMIVVNTEDLQEFAARKVFDQLGNPSCHENIIKVGAYILGEYGHLIADEPGRSPLAQLTLLTSHSLVTTSTKALLLTTYFKWLNLFPEIRSQILEIFVRFSRVLDVELQQRACEYLAIAKRSEGNNGDGGELLQIVVDEMPPYPERESALLNRLMKKNGDTGDKRTWHIGGKEVNVGADLERFKGLGRRATVTTEPEIPIVVEGGVAGVLGELEGLDLNSQTPIPTPTRQESAVTHGTAKAFNSLIYNSSGILYEDSQIQVGIKSAFQASSGRLSLFYGNKISVPLESFTATLSGTDEPSMDGVEIGLDRILEPRLGPMSQILQIVKIETKGPFSGTVLLNISYLAGSHQTISMRLPILITKFLSPVQLSTADFFTRWKGIGVESGLEQQIIFPFFPEGSGRERRVVEGFGFGILEGVGGGENLVGAGVLDLGVTGKVGVLTRVEPNAAAKLCRLTVRSTNAAASEEVAKLLVEVLRKAKVI